MFRVVCLIIVAYVAYEASTSSNIKVEIQIDNKEYPNGENSGCSGPVWVLMERWKPTNTEGVNGVTTCRTNYFNAGGNLTKGKVYGETCSEKGTIWHIGQSQTCYGIKLQSYMQSKKKYDWCTVKWIKVQYPGGRIFCNTAFDKQTEAHYETNDVVRCSICHK